MQAFDDSRPLSLLTPVGYQTGSCGYCKDQSSSASYYALSKHLDTEHYQALIDRGWRRSGTLLYKPDVRLACCRHYTIRLPAAEFKASKDQRQAVNRWNRYVLGDTYIKEAARLHPKSKEEKARQRNGFDLIEAVHESEYDTIRKSPEPAHRFEVNLEPDNFTEEKYALFENYQRNVHHESPAEISRAGFRRFLCSSPLRRTSRVVNGVEQRLGSFHQCYRLDGRLIAMAVLDLLPHCVSGVYFLYHSDFEKWSFGKLSTLREIALALEGGYQYYYMGYYIHTCAKMRYKADYKPQYILVPESHKWTPLDEEIKQKLSLDCYMPLTRRRDPSQTPAVQSQSAEKEENGEVAMAGTPEESANINQVDEADQAAYPFASAAEAAAAIQSGLSLFELAMPGVMTVEEVMEQIDLDEILISVRNNLIVRMEDLVAWQEGSVSDAHSLKGLVAELAACVGPEVASGMVVKLST